MSQEFYQRLRSELKARKEAGNLRELPFVQFSDDNIVLDHTRYIDLSSNDYLGIARDIKFLSTFIETMTDTSTASTGSDFAGKFLLRTVGAGSTGSRLLTGNHYSFAYFEDLVATLYNRCIFSNQFDGPCVDEAKLKADLQSGSLSKNHANKAQDSDLYPDIDLYHNDKHGNKSKSKTKGKHKEKCAHKGHNGAVAYEEQKLYERCLDGTSSSLSKRTYERECLYLNSGFDANLGILSTLFTKNDLLLVDKLCHASIIDGMLASKAKSMRYAHNDMEHLASLLDKYHNDYESIVIVTESIFSMDGDRAKLAEIAALKERYDNVLIYVDEAHSFGLLGEEGLGLCQELNIVDKVDFLMATLSKAIGSYGAFLICSKEVKDYLVNFMRPLIFATALPPVNVTFSLYVVGLMTNGDMQYKRDYLKQIIEYLHNNLAELGINPSQSQIQPLITGDSQKALQACDIFKHYGLLALPIRHPTVPQNQARLRLSLNCNLRVDDLDLITKVVKHYRHLFV